MKDVNLMKNAHNIWRALTANAVTPVTVALMLYAKSSDIGRYVDVRQGTRGTLTSDVKRVSPLFSFRLFFWEIDFNWAHRINGNDWLPIYTF